MALRLIVMGTTEFAVPSLEMLAESQHEVVAVYTQPPRPAGRGHRERMTPVHEAAMRLGLEVRTPASLKTREVQEEFRSWKADLAVVGAYGLLLPKPVLNAPRLGCINLHGSLLPRWRGAAPIQRAILAGDHKSGISIFEMEEGLDTGPVYAMQPVPIHKDTTAGALHDALAALAANMLPDVLADLESGKAVARPQPAHGVTYASKIAKDEAHLDFARPAVDVERQVRAFTPFPGAFCFHREERLIVSQASPVDAIGKPGYVIELPLTVACGEGSLEIERVHRAGRKPMTADELQRGYPIRRGERLT